LYARRRSATVWTVPPERLLRAVLLQIFYTVRSERMLMEQMNYNLLFRWFVGLELDEPVWNHAVFSKNRDRLLNQEVAQEFFRRVLAQAKPHLSDEHFSVDGTLIEAWASQKSFQKKDGGDDSPGEFRGDKRSNSTHQSKTDPLRSTRSSVCTPPAQCRRRRWLAESASLSMMISVNTVRRIRFFSGIGASG
jgi:Transposase domain (DUF772)